MRRLGKISPQISPLISTMRRLRHRSRVALWASPRLDKSKTSARIETAGACIRIGRWVSSFVQWIGRWVSSLVWRVERLVTRRNENQHVHWLICMVVVCCFAFDRAAFMIWCVGVYFVVVCQSMFLQCVHQSSKVFVLVWVGCSSFVVGLPPAATIVFVFWGRQASEASGQRSLRRTIKFYHSVRDRPGG